MPSETLYLDPQNEASWARVQELEAPKVRNLLKIDVKIIEKMQNVLFLCQYFQNSTLKY